MFKQKKRTKQDLILTLYLADIFTYMKECYVEENSHTTYSVFSKEENYGKKICGSLIAPPLLSATDVTFGTEYIL